MDLFAIIANRLAFCSLLAIFVISLSQPVKCFAAGDKLSGQDAAVVGDLEQRLFFQKFADDDAGHRVARIEKQVYGEVLEQPMPDRMARLRQMLEEKKSAETAQQQEAQQRALIQKQQQASASPPGGYAPPQQQNDFDRARENIIAAREDEMRQLLADGVELWRQRRAQEATGRFEQVLRLDPTNAEAHFSLGIIEESTGNLVEALSSYQQAAQAQPQIKEYGDAVRTLEKKLQTRQVSVGQQAALRMLAEGASAAFKQGEYVKALDLYKTLDSKAPNQALVKYNIGTLYLMMKDSSNALSYYKQAVKLNPTEPRYSKAYNELKAQADMVANAAAEQKRQQEEMARQTGMKLPKQKKGKGGQSMQMTPNQIPVQSMGRASFGGNSAPMPAAPQSQVFGGYMPTPQNDLMAKYGLGGKGTSDGVKVTNIGIASRASAAGIQVGDNIRAVDGTEVYDTRKVNEMLARKGFNERVQMLIMRNGQLGVINL